MLLCTLEMERKCIGQKNVIYCKFCGLVGTPIFSMLLCTLEMEWKCIMCSSSCYFGREVHYVQ